ncbi:glycosyltransferase [Gloeobacter kilaueensis]|uniref:Glycosyl transferase group 1 n=1 Tax=Gloeobacter kilaueensis (strain ATCC BAA-2537 / CCAP 1431/1 / ULC 316 / JS1) TaxID=1183438 RepID=U5QCC8_GLOK1|nr:glycosyltransferase [Gloeobacter kilaueensis]AGY56521.1 glycosyl transferase group 1 [Gloeobacter kilaueensis JS1]
MQVIARKATRKSPVLTIFYQFNPWGNSIGGIQTVIRTFVKYAPPTFDIRLVGVGEQGSTPVHTWQERELEGRQIHFLSLFNLDERNVNFRSRSRIPHSVRYTAALLGRDYSSDFLHFHRIEPAALTRHWPGVKTLFIHNDIRQQMQTNHRNAMLWQQWPGAYYLFERALVGQFNHIYACNNAAVHLYQQLYPRLAARVQYYRNTVDKTVFYCPSLQEREQQRRLLSTRLNLAEQTRFVLFAGRLHPQKDPLLLVQAFAILPPELKVHLLIAGEGELQQELQEEIVKLNLQGQVTLLGKVNQPELAALYRLASVFVLTSAYEGLPLAVLEALASGTPVVSTRTGETPNFLSPASGELTTERTAEAVAAALMRVISSPEAYPSSACTEVARPYEAESVVQSVFADMWACWEGSLIGQAR